MMCRPLVRLLAGGRAGQLRPRACHGCGALWPPASLLLGPGRCGSFTLLCLNPTLCFQGSVSAAAVTKDAQGLGSAAGEPSPHSLLPWETLTWCRGTELALRAAMSLPVCLSGQTA